MNKYYYYLTLYIENSETYTYVYDESPDCSSEEEIQEKLNTWDRYRYYAVSL